MRSTTSFSSCVMQTPPASTTRSSTTRKLPPTKAAYTRHNRLYNGFDNRLHRVVYCPCSNLPVGPISCTTCCIVRTLFRLYPLLRCITTIYNVYNSRGWLGSRVVSVLDSGVEGPGFKSQRRRCLVTVLGKLFTPIVPLFTKQRNW